MVNTKRFLKFGRDLAKGNPNITTKKVVSLWQILLVLQSNEKSLQIQKCTRGSLFDIKV